MTTIVMNALSGAITEYDWNFQSITQTHAGDATGLYLLGGEFDNAAPIISIVRTGNKQWGSSLKKIVASVYFAMRGEGEGSLTVFGRSAAYEYKFPVRASGQSRCVTGRGIRENYLAFGYRNIDSVDFEIDKIEVQSAQSTSRRL